MTLAEILNEHKRIAELCKSRAGHPEEWTALPEYVLRQARAIEKFIELYVEDGCDCAGCKEILQILTGESEARG